MDVSAPQINFEGKDATGRFLIAAVDGRVVGLRARRPRIDSLSPKSPTGDGEEAHWGRREVRVTLKHAQAHVAPTDVDVNAGVQWLDESAFCGDATSLGSGSGSGSSSGTTQAPGSSSGSGAGARSSSYLLRRVFEPCVMDMAFITHIPERARCADASDDPNAAVVDHDGSSSAAASAPASVRARSRDGRRPEALTEFALRSPDVEAELDADQFAALVDVIGSVFLAQLEDPPPRPSAAAAALLAAEGRSLVEGEERASAAVVAGPLAAYKMARWRAVAARKDAADADARAFAGWSRAPGREEQEDGEGGTKTPPGGTPLETFRPRRVFAAVAALERAADDAESAVASAVASAEALVRPNRRRPAIKLSLAVDTFRWVMRAGGRAFLAAKISKLTLSRERHTDSSGMTKFVCAELALEIPPNKARAARGEKDAPPRSASAPRPVLSRWDPDNPSNANARRRRDTPMFRVHALRAASPPEAPIWDHIEVSVQPFDLRVEREMYDRVIAYVFPEKAGVNPKTGPLDARRDAFGRGLSRGNPNPGARFHATGVSAASQDSGGGGADRISAAAAEPSAASTSESDARRILLGSPPPRSTPGKRGGARQGHARSKTWGADLFGVGSRAHARDSKTGHARRGSGSEARDSSALDADAILDGLIQEQGERAAASATLGERVARPPSLILPAASESECVPPDRTLGGSSSSKTVVVRYLRVNDVLLRVSYDGAPRSFHEVRLLLDASTHAGFRGRWRELVDKLKGNVVWSVLKSVTGLQGKRLAGASRTETIEEAPTRVRVRGDDGAKPEPGPGPGPGPRANRDDDAFDDDLAFAFGGDAGYDEELDQLGSPTAAAIVAESDGLVVAGGGPSAGGSSLFRRVFGGSKTVAVKSKNKTAADRDRERERERARMVSSWGGKR